MGLTDNMIRVATIGSFGHWTCVLDEIRDLDGVSVVAATAAMTGESVASVVAHGASPKDIAVFGDYPTMLKKVRPDIVVLSCRLDLIPKIAMDAARAGCDIICEKPLALDVSTLQKLHQVVSENGVRLMAMLSMRADPVFQTARRLFQDGAIGEVVVANARKTYKYGDRPDWFGVRKMYGGTMLWVGIHALDMIHFITGQTFNSVAALQRNFAHPQRSDCEDCVAAILSLQNGGVATVSVDLLRPEVAPTHGDDWIRIVGTHGIIEARSNDRVVRLLKDTAETKSIACDPARLLYRPFLVRGTSDDGLMGPDDPFLLTHACLCAREAADAGVVEQIPALPWLKTTTIEAGVQ